ncbi:MAG: histidinol dehydrogenase [Thermoplasmata archaeon]
MNLEKYVREILADLKENREEALDNYSEKFDGYVGDYKVSKEELKAAEEIPEKDKKVIDRIIERVKKVHEKQTQEDRLILEEDSIYGLIKRPIERIGIYVPGGKPLPSTLIMVGVPALIAGVEEIVVTTPPVEGEVNPYVLYVARSLGIDGIYKIGGIQAIGSLTYGIMINKVDKIYGPGNRFVNEAKRQVYGDVGIDCLAGPSEVAVIADETSDFDSVRYDLLAQAEHDDDAKSWLLTNSEELANEIDLGQVSVIVLPTLEGCVEKANEIAPEHLEILTGNPRELLPSVKNAGAVYLGRYTPGAAADYFLGVNHVLPTDGAAKYSSVLTVDDFTKKISVAESGYRDFVKDSELGERMAEIEDMEYHRRSIEVRNDEKKD